MKYVPRIFIVVAFMVALALGLVQGLTVASGEIALMRGAHEMQGAEAQLRSLNNRQTASLLFARALLDTERAHADFRSADQHLRMVAPILRRLSWLPRIGDEVAASPAVAQLALQVTQGLLALLHAGDPAVSVLSRKAGPTRTRQLLVQLALAGPYFQQSYRTLAKAEQMRHRLQGHQAPQVTRALRTLDQQLPHLLTLDRSLLLLPRLLGYPERRTYLVAFQDGPDLRWHQGFSGYIGGLTVQDGAAAKEFKPAWIGVHHSSSDPVQFYDMQSGWLFGHSRWLPSFATMAVLEDFSRTSQPPVTGIIDLTYSTVGSILAVTGPFYSSQYRIWITQHNAAALLRSGAPAAGQQGAALGGRAGSSALAPRGRESMAKIIGNYALARLGYLSLSDLIRLGQTIDLQPAHPKVFLSFKDPNEEALVHALHAG